MPTIYGIREHPGHTNNPSAQPDSPVPGQELSDPVLLGFD